MTNPDNSRHNPTRRNFLTRAAVAAVTTPLAKQAFAKPQQTIIDTPGVPVTLGATEPFWGKHQGGIATPMQRSTYFMAFELVTNERAELIALLRAWTAAAAEMTHGPAQADPHPDPTQMPADSGDTIGLASTRLTITFGFGPSLFEKDGVDRFGLAKQRPAALADLPHFTGDQLIPERTGGDLSVQACADDQQVVEHAIRRMVGLASGIAKIRWAQTGFSAGFKAGETPRNQMGFKDGTMNISAKDPATMNQFVWVGEEGPGWMRDGSYMVIRPIRIALEHWDRMKLGFQEETVGRHKYSGAPIGKQHEFDSLDLDATDKDGNPLIAENSHSRLAAPASNDGAQILRRAFAYDNGVAQIAERWPPWRQAMTFDAGLLFQCYQRDPRTGFSKMFEKMAKFDMLNQFTTHIGSGLFACPPGAKPGEYIGQRLFD
jgi:deferrochelatase/peroxidase EfeB